MKYMDVGCNINCWECNEKCDFKEILQISIYLPITEQYVYSEIMEILKAQAGQLLLSGISKEVFLTAYRCFKNVVGTKSEEKQIDKEFEEVSGYSIYRVFQASKESDWIKL